MALTFILFNGEKYELLWYNNASQSNTKKRFVKNEFNLPMCENRHLSVRTIIRDINNSDNKQCTRT